MERKVNSVTVICRFLIKIFILLLMFQLIVVAQSKKDIKLGDSYSSVIYTLQNEFGAQYHQISKLEDKILVSTISGSGLPEDVIYEYYFKNNLLVKTKMISHAPNANNLLAWSYQQGVTNSGEPLTLEYDGNKAYSWPKQTGKNSNISYLFTAYSDWFQDQAVYSVSEVNKQISEPDNIYSDKSLKILQEGLTMLQEYIGTFSHSEDIDDHSSWGNKCFEFTKWVKANINDKFLRGSIVICEEALEDAYVYKFHNHPDIKENQTLRNYTGDIISKYKLSTFPENKRTERILDYARAELGIARSIIKH